MESLSATTRHEIIPQHLELNINFNGGLRGLDYSYSDAEILYDALQAHRDSLIKDLEEACDLYATQPHISQAEFQAALTSGDFVILLDQIKVLNTQIDNITRHALALLRQQK